MRCTERKLMPAARASIRPVGSVLRTLPTRPMGCFFWRRPKRQIDHPLHGAGRKRRLAGLTRLVAQLPIDPFRHEPGLPSPHHRLRFARSAHDLGSAAAIGGGQDDIGAPHMLLRRAAVRDDRPKPAAVGARDGDDNSCSHAESLNCFGRFGNRPNESDH